MQRRALDVVLIDRPRVLTMWLNQETGLSEFIMIVFAQWVRDKSHNYGKGIMVQRINVKITI